MNHKLSNPTNAFKRMSNGVQLSLVLLVTGLLCVTFFSLPHNTKKQLSVGGRVSSDSILINHNTQTAGIGGGNIIGNCVAGKKALPIYCVDINSKNSSQADSNSSASSSAKEQKYVSISFDAAWGADDTIKILDILDKYNVKTTFFMTGGWVESFPDMVVEIYSRGHDLGNHSQNHKQMSKLSANEQAEEINSVSKSVKALTDYDMFLFRPPYGDYNNTLINTVYSCNYYPIQWSVDSLDWKDYGVDNIIKTVTKHKALDNGAIILLHNGSKFTADALESVITGLQKQGYTLVPISELIIRNNFHMDDTGKQIAD